MPERSSNIQLRCRLRDFDHGVHGIEGRERPLVRNILAGFGVERGVVPRAAGLLPSFDYASFDYGKTTRLRIPRRQASAGQPLTK